MRHLIVQHEKILTNRSNVCQSTTEILRASAIAPASKPNRQPHNTVQSKCLNISLNILLVSFHLPMRSILQARNLSISALSFAVLMDCSDRGNHVHVEQPLTVEESQL